MRYLEDNSKLDGEEKGEGEVGGNRSMMHVMDVKEDRGIGLPQPTL